MSADAAELLRSLAGASRPGVGGSSPGSTPRVEEGSAFDRMLERARTGSLRSDQPVRVPGDLGLELSPEQMGRLNDAADRAEAAGAEQALVAIDGALVKLDVVDRAVTDRVRTRGGDVVSGIDAFIDASAAGGGSDNPLTGDSGAAGGMAGRLAGLAGSAAGLNPSLVRALAGLGQGGGAGEGVERDSAG